MKYSKGFTLIEMLVALVVVGVAGVSIQATYSRIVDQRQYVNDRLIASMVVWNIATADFLNLDQINKDAVSSLDFGGRSWIVKYTDTPTILGDVIKKEVKVSEKALGAGSVSLTYYR